MRVRMKRERHARMHVIIGFQGSVKEGESSLMCGQGCLNGLINFVQTFDVQTSPFPIIDVAETPLETKGR